MVCHNNPRIHDAKQVRQIANSIVTFGFNVPVLIDSTKRVIAGHGRLAACKMLNISEVPTISLEHLTEAQARAFLIADNRLTENAEWDDRLLAEQLKALSELDLDFSLEATGFEMGEIDFMIEGLASGSESDCDPADAVPEEAAAPQVSRLGDFWKLDRHRVLCGDALKAESLTALMKDHKAAAVFIDPLYNVPIDGHVSGKGKVRHHEFAMASGEMTVAEFTEFLTQSFTLLAQYSSNGSLHYVCMDWRHMGELLAAGQKTPRSLKSHCATVAFPAWLLGHNPGAQIICASYSQDLAEKHARDCRTLMQKKRYQELFPTRLSAEKSAAAEFTTTEGGFRLSTSVGGQLTGRGAEFIIIDDPLSRTGRSRILSATM